MTKSKLGMFVQSLGAFDAVEWCRIAQPRILVSMDHNPDAWREIKRVSPNTFVVGRRNTGDENQDYNVPEQNADVWFMTVHDDIEKMRGLYDAWMVYNESVPQSADDAMRLSRLYVRAGDLLHSQGVKAVAYSFSVMQPPLALWDYLLDGLRHCDFLGLHEYGAPTMQGGIPDYCLRYRRVWEKIPWDAQRLFIIGECGIDGGVISRPQEGWRKFTDEPGYLSQLKWYDDQVQQDWFVLGAAIFQASPWGVDGSFQTGNAQSIRDYIGEGGSPAKVVLRYDAYSVAFGLITRFEGFQQVPTGDVGGGKTIGYGHTIQPGEYFPVISRAQANELLYRDMRKYASYIDNGVTVPLNDNQYGALVSFVYNVGGGAFKSSDLLIKLNQGNYQGAADELLRWVHGGGQVLPGLVTRRQVERTVFLS